MSMSWSSPLGAQRPVLIPPDHDAEMVPPFRLGINFHIYWTVLLCFMGSMFVEREKGFRDCTVVLWR